MVLERSQFCRSLGACAVLLEFRVRRQDRAASRTVQWTAEWFAEWFAEWIAEWIVEWSGRVGELFLDSQSSGSLQVHHAVEAGRPARILLSDFTKTFGGAPEHAVSLIKYLRLSREAEMYFLSPQEELRGRTEEAGGVFLPLTISNDRLGKPAGPGALRHIVFLLREWLLEELPLVSRVVRAGRHSQCDLVHLNNLPSFQRAAILAAKILRKPCLATHQGFENPSRSLRYLFPLVDMHVAISRAVERDILSYGVKPEKIRLIHDAIDTSRFHTGVEAANLFELFRIPVGSPVFGIIGRVVPWKGHEVFLEVAAEVLRKLPHAWGIVVGDVSDGDRSFETLLKDKAKELGIAGKIIFAGRRSDVPQVVRALNVTLHLSREPEGLGLVVAEALAVGTPVVGMNEGGVPDILQHEKSGFLCAPQDIASIARAVEELLSNAPLRAQFGEFGARDMALHFSGERCAARYAEVYREMLSSVSSK